MSEDMNKTNDSGVAAVCNNTQKPNVKQTPLDTRTIVSDTNTASGSGTQAAVSSASTCSKGKDLKNDPKRNKVKNKTRHSEEKRTVGKLPKNVDKKAEKDVDIAKRLNNLESMLEQVVTTMFYNEEDFEPEDSEDPQEEGELKDPSPDLSMDGSSRQFAFGSPNLETQNSNLKSVSITDPAQAAGQNFKIPKLNRPRPTGFAAKYAVPVEEGDAISKELAENVDYLLTSKLEEKYITETGERYQKPANSSHLLIPKVNPIVWDNLAGKSRFVDLKIQRCQKPLVKGLTAFITLLNNKQE